MKDCKVYYKKLCIRKDESICFDNSGVCELQRDKSECIDCNKEITECYSCEHGTGNKSKKL